MIGGLERLLLRLRRPWVVPLVGGAVLAGFAVQQAVAGRPWAVAVEVVLATVNAWTAGVLRERWRDAPTVQRLRGWDDETRAFFQAVASRNGGRR